MALSGRISGSVGQNSSYFSFYIDWAVTNTQADRIANNRSVVRARVYLATNNTARKFDTVSVRDHWVEIDGVRDNYSMRANFNPWPSNPRMVREFTRTVNHNADGTKSINISARFDAYVPTWGAGQCNASATVTLDTIPRVSTPTLSPASQTIGNSLTINFNRASSSFTHTATYSLGSASGTITTKSTATSVSWTLPTSLTSQLTSASRSGTITVTTYSGNTNLGSKAVSFTAKLPAMGNATLNMSSQNLGGSVTVTTPRTIANYTHTITYALGSASGTIATKSTSGSQTWTLPTSLGSQMPTSSSRAGTVTVTAYHGDYKVGSKTISLTFVVPSNSTFNPTATGLTASIYGSGFDATTIQGYVQGISRVAVSFTGTAKGGATVASRTIKIGTANHSGSSATSSVLNTSGTVSIVATVTDSRGRSASTNTSINVLAYSPPNITTFSASRISGTNQANVSRAGTWSNLSGKNILTVRIRQRPFGGSWTYLVDTTMTSGTLSGSITATGLSDSASYDFEFTLTDSFGRTTTATSSIGTAKVALSIAEDKGIGAGKIWERGALDVGGDIYCDGSYVGGFGSVRIPSGADLNDYTSVGFFYNPSNAEVGTMANTPTAQAFSLLVEKHAGTKQTFTVYNTSNVSTYVRNYYNGTWSAWRQVWNNTGQAVDADKVDGKHASDFANASHSHSWSSITSKPSTFPPASHSHSYLPLSGGTLTGDLYFSGANRYIGTSTNHDFYIRVNNVTRLSCYSNGTFRFIVPADGEYTIYVDISGVYNGATRPTIRPSASTYGYVGTSNYRFYQMYASGGFQSTSERSMKENIIPEATISDYNLVKKMKFYRYNLKPEYEGGKPALRKTRKPIVAYTEGKAVVTGHVEEEAVKRNEYLGVMVDELPDFITDEARTSINLYTYSSVIGAALQETIRRLEELEAKIELKETEVQ